MRQWYNQGVREISPKSFIFELENALPGELCDEIVRRFEADTRRAPGVIASLKVNKGVKDTVDLHLSRFPEWKDLDTKIYEALKTHLAIVMPCLTQGLVPIPAHEDSGYNIQKYEPGSNGYVWHMDMLPNNDRQRMLVFIYYLNDVSEGGETEFLQHEVSVKPAKGKLVFFPPFWTHVHRSAPNPKEAKYIVTGWIEMLLRSPT